jgi:hypothetical protein
MSRVDWDALEWWEQRLLREGLNAEFAENSGGSTSGAPAGQPGGTTTVNEHVVLDGNHGEMAALGFKEMTL